MRDEVAPDGHEGFVEVGALVGRWRTKVGCYVGSMPGADDGVLVFVSDAVVVCEGFGEPVGRADEGRFCVDILERTSALSHFTGATHRLKIFDKKSCSRPRVAAGLCQKYSH